MIFDIYIYVTFLSQQWILDRQDLIRERQNDLQFMSDEEHQKVLIFFCNCKFIKINITPNCILKCHDNSQKILNSTVMQTLGEQLKLRQQVIATATVYFKRFYARNSLKCIDPLLLAPTSIFLASKVEEFGVISNSRLVSTCHQVG